MTRLTYEELEKRIKELREAYDEGKNVEQELKSALKWSEVIFEGSRDAIFICDTDSKFISVNNAACELTGYSKKELLDMRIPDLHEEIDLDAYKKYFSKIMEGEKILSEAKILRKDGKKVDAEFNSQRVEIEGKSCMHSVARDVSERKTADEALQESEEKYRTFTENINVGIYRSTPGAEGKIVEGNPAIIKMFGYDNKDEFLAHKASDTYQDPADRALFNKNILKNGFIKNEEMLYKRKDGAQFIASETAIAVKDEKGKLLFFDGIVEDITEIKKTEKIKNVLFEVSKSVNVTNNLDELFQSIHNILSAIINTDNIYIALYDEIEDTISYPYFIDEFDKPYKPFKIADSRSSCAFIIKKGKSLYRTEEVYTEMLEKGEVEPVGSIAKIWLGVPLIVKRKVIGVLVVQSYNNPDLYNSNDIHLLEYVSEQIALAVQRKKAEEERENLLDNVGKRVKELGCLYEISRLIEKPGISIEEILREAVNLIPSGWNYPEITCSRIVLDNKEYETKNFKRSKWKQSADIIVHEKTVGAIEVYYLKEKPELDEGPFVKEERDLINELAERIGGVIERIQAENIRKVLHGINEAMVTSQTLYELLAKIHAEVNSLMDAKNFFTALYDKENDHYTYPYHFDVTEKWDLTKPQKIENGLTEYVRKHNKPLFLNKMKFQEMIDSGKSLLIGAESESWMGVPLLHENEVIGVVVVQSYTDADAYSENDLNVLTLISGQLTMAIMRKKAEEALQASERSYLDIFNSSNDGIIIHDMNSGEILDANKRICEMLEYSKVEVLNSDIGELSQGESPYTKKDGEKRIKEAIEEGVSNFEWLCKKKNGELFWADITLKQVVINGKECIIAVTRDINERKQLEDQLQIRQRMDSLGTLAGGIAHDFNNILVGIMGNIDFLLLDDEDFSETQLESLNDAMISCERAAELIKQFQILSRGAVRKKSSTDIYDISNEVFKFLKETTDRLITKQIKFKKGEFFVNADPGELHQVLLNLATNSAQAIEERKVKKGEFIRINAEDYKLAKGDRIGLAEGDYIHISFEDSGVGMSEEIMMRAFDPMFTTKDKSGKRGQGLGLAMVYNIVTRIYKGHIYIDSAEGEGTTFHMYLPRTLPVSEPGSETVIDMKGGNETILIVDDEPVVTKLSKKMLIDIGYSVLTASDGKEALSIYEKQKDSIDIVILDLSMPHMSGQQVFLKMQEINPEVKVIISSGHSDEYTQEGILAEANGRVGKPYKMLDLTKILRDVLDS
ncbi:MAG: PAS domain S-box protein [bacterium]|nr:PAS domain S-box protein [bacterium]